jgi:hypothetical protein
MGGRKMNSEGRAERKRIETETDKVKGKRRG